MISRAEAKETLRCGIIAKSTEINVDCFDVMSIIREVLRENPTLSVYIAGFSVSAALFPACSVAKIRYKNSDIPDTRVFYAKSEIDVNNFLHKAMEAYMPDIVIVADKSIDVSAIMGDFWNYYEGFYSNFLSYKTSSSSFNEASTRETVIKFKYRIGRVMLNIMENAVDSEVDRIRKFLFCSGMSDIVKAYIAHNYLAATIKYAINENPTTLERSHMQSAYGGLIHHECVCQGYAEAYKRLLDTEGVFCDVVCGKIRGSQEYHAWNIIELDGENYHVDVTWDSDSDRSVDFEYFCVSDKDLNSERYWTRRMNLACLSERNIKEEACAEIKKNKALYIARGIDKQYLI